MLLGLIGIGVLIYLLVSRNTLFSNRESGKDSPIELLTLRYVNGEIDEETYLRMKKIIEK